MLRLHFVKFPGWGRLVFFETKKVPLHGFHLGDIFPTILDFPTLGNSWKVIFDLRPDEDTAAWQTTFIRIYAGGALYCSANLCTPSRASLNLANGNVMSANYQLKMGEWNRIEITHEESEGGNFSLSVGGKQSVKLDVGNLEQEKFSDVRLHLGSDGPRGCRTRGLIVIEKS